MNTFQPPPKVAEYLKSFFDQGYEITTYSVSKDAVPLHEYTVEKLKPYHRTHAVSFYYNPDGSVKLYRQRCSPRPQICDRCGKKPPKHQVHVEEGDEVILVCDDCWPEKKEYNAIVEWGWGDLFGVEGCAGNPQPDPRNDPPKPFYKNVAGR